MSKETFLAFLGVLIFAILGVSIYYATSGVKDIEIDDTGNDNTVITDNNSDDSVEGDDSYLSSYTFTNEFGDGEKEVTVKAKKCDRLSGFTGASSNVFYIDGDDKLHYLELADLTDKVLATNIVDFKVVEDGIIAYYEKTYSKVEDSDFVTYNKKDY